MMKLKYGKAFVIVFLLIFYNIVGANQEINSTETTNSDPPIYSEIQINIIEITNKLHKISQVEKFLKQINILENKNKNILFLEEKLLKKKEILLQEEQEKKQNTVQNILLGYSEGGNEIFAYYKGDISKPFFGIFANIHGGYEYGTYFTAKYLLEILEKSKKTQWFIIPTINPDGLQIAFENNFDQKYYIQGRENSNGIELNRNFCTENFFVHSYVKLGKNFYSGGNCNSQQESKIIDIVLQNFDFSEILSLHSEGGIFFIPDNSYLDPRITSLVEKLKVLLPKYYYEFPTNDDNKNKNIISIVEINSGKKIKKYSGLMENYIYQKYDIPIVLIELKVHGEIEYDLHHILEYL